MQLLLQNAVLSLSSNHMYLLRILHFVFVLQIEQVLGPPSFLNILLPSLHRQSRFFCLFMSFFDLFPILLLRFMFFQLYQLFVIDTQLSNIFRIALIFVPHFLNGNCDSFAFVAYFVGSRVDIPGDPIPGLGNFLIF